MEPKEVNAVPDSLDLVCQSSELSFAAHDESGVPTFKMVAYTGGTMVVPFWSEPVVIDLGGLKIPSQTRPVRFQHREDAGVGHTTLIEVRGTKLIAEGTISRATSEAIEIIESSKKGFPWQASVGVSAEDVEFISDGIRVNVNGKNLKGPLFVLKKSILGEISFVDLGADDKTKVVVTAQEKEISMAEEVKNKETKSGSESVESSGGDSKESKSKPLVEVKAEGSGKEVLSPSKEPAPTPKIVEASAVSGDDFLQERRKQEADEIRRVEGIRKIHANGDHPDLEAKAIEEGWNLDRCELEVLRASRPTVTAVHVRSDQVESPGKILEAAAMITGKAPEIEKLYDEEILDEAHRRFRQGIGLQELILEAAWANGYTGRNFKVHREVLRAAFGKDVQAAFSTVDIGGILSNIANKFLLDGFFSVEDVWRTIAATRPVKDFKTVTSYRLIGKDQYELVAPGGELKHGDLGQETFTNKADTYGLLLNVSRTDIINDDLGALTTIPRKLGRGSGLKINDVFWTVFLDDATHFVSGNNNYIEGSATKLDITGLETGEKTFMDQVDEDGKPIGIMPTILLVPTGLSAIAASLFKSTELRDTTSSTRYPVANPHQGKFTPVVSRYLGNSSFSGNSQLAWYLLANSADLATVEIAFLNGQESPTIETAEANFDVLGIQMRGFHDFGVALQDPKGAMKSKGEA